MNMGFNLGRASATAGDARRHGASVVAALRADQMVAGSGDPRPGSKPGFSGVEISGTVVVACAPEGGSISVE